MGWEISSPPNLASVKLQFSTRRPIPRVAVICPKLAFPWNVLPRITTLSYSVFSPPVNPKAIGKGRPSSGAEKQQFSINIEWPLGIWIVAKALSTIGLSYLKVQFLIISERQTQFGNAQQIRRAMPNNASAASKKVQSSTIKEPWVSPRRIPINVEVSSYEATLTN